MHYILNMPSSYIVCTIYLLHLTSCPTFHILYDCIGSEYNPKFEHHTLVYLLHPISCIQAFQAIQGHVSTTTGPSTLSASLLTSASLSTEAVVCQLQIPRSWEDSRLNDSRNWLSQNILHIGSAKRNCFCYGFIDTVQNKASEGGDAEWFQNCGGFNTLQKHVSSNFDQFIFKGGVFTIIIITIVQ